MTAGDPAVYNRLQTQGFGVEIRDENTVNASHADGKDVVIISSTVSSSALTSIFKDVAVPLLTWEAYIYDDMKLTGSGGNNLGVSYGQTQIQITQSSHSMAAGLSGTVSVYNNASDLAWGKPTAGAEVIASLAGDANKAVIFGYETGASMEGIAAPARRVGFFLFNDAANQLSTQGWNLFDAALTWVMDASPPSGNIPPVAILNLEPASGCAPLTVTFQADQSYDPDGQIVGYDWLWYENEMGYGTSGGSTAIITHTYTQAGTHPVTVTVIDNKGAKDVVTVEITICDGSNQAPISDFGWIANGLSVSFDANNSSDQDGNIVEYRWDFGDGSDLLVNPNPQISHSYNQAGSFQVSLMVEDDGGATHQSTQIITLNSPVADIDLWQEGECGILDDDWATASATEASNGSYTYPTSGQTNIFSKPASSSPDYARLSFDIQEADTYYLWARVNANGTNQDSYWVRMDGGEWTKWNTIQDNGTNFVWDQVHDSDMGAAPLSFELGPGTHQIDFHLREPNVQLDKVYLTNVENPQITGQGGTAPSCGSTNEAPVAQITATPSSGTAPLTVSFSGSNSTDDGTIQSYAWTFGDGNSGTTENTSHTYTQAGSFTASLTVTDDGGLSHSSSINITVNEDNPGGSGDILFVVNQLPATQGDPAIQARLQSLGYSVSLVDDDVLTVQDADGKFLILISSTVSSSKVNSTFTQTAVPLITWEAYLYDDLKMMPNGQGIYYEFENLQSQLQILDASHAMAAGFSGTQTVVSSAGDIPWGKPGGDAQIVASLAGDASKAVIFGFEAGANMDNFTAPARRVGLFLKNNTPLNDVGWQLLDAAVYWAVGWNASTADPPIASFLASALFGTPGLNVYFNASNSTGNITSYEWDFGDGNTDNGVLVSHTFSNAGTFSVTLTVFDNAGNFDVETKSIVIIDPSSSPFEFYSSISRSTLENYLTRSASMIGLSLAEYGLCNDGSYNCNSSEYTTEFQEDLEMIQRLRPKFLGRVSYIWESAYYPLVKSGSYFMKVQKIAELIHNVDGEIILQAAVFEYVGQEINNAQIEIPKYVWEEFNPSIPWTANIYFNHNSITYNSLSNTPDMNKLQAQMWFYYLATQYIHAGYESIHFGQFAIMNDSDPQNQGWWSILSKVREFALNGKPVYGLNPARRKIVICDAHLGTDSPYYGNSQQLLFDMHASPSSVQEDEKIPGVNSNSDWIDDDLRMGYINELEGSFGGISANNWGWTSSELQNLPYLVELDHGGPVPPDCRHLEGEKTVNEGGGSNCNGQNYAYKTWGWDEFTWFSFQNSSYRDHFLIYMADKVKEFDQNAFFQVPLRRQAKSNILLLDYSNPDYFPHFNYRAIMGMEIKKLPF